jgi:hypothetical protein
MEKVFDFELYKQNLKYRNNVLEAILFSSLTPERLRLPTGPEFILSELVNGTIEYIGGNAGKMNYRNFEEGHYEFRRRMEKYLSEEMRKFSKGKLDPKIGNAVNKLCECYYPDSSDKTRVEVNFFSHFNWGICQSTNQSTFSLPYDLVIKTREKTIPSLSDSERKDVEGIGKSLGKYLDKDLEYIKKNYFW